MLPLLGTMSKASTLPTATGGGVAVGHLRTVLVIVSAAVAAKFPADSAWRTAQVAGNVSVGVAANQKCGNGVAFLLRELMVAHV